MLLELLKVLFVALEPPPGKAPSFAQLYVLDRHAIADTVTGMCFGDRVKVDIVEALADVLKNVNAYVRHFRRAASIDQSLFEHSFIA